jgi:acyl-coenzyme A synthetase/AMP-(fatty) acid ligase
MKELLIKHRTIRYSSASIGDGDHRCVHTDLSDHYTRIDGYLTQVGVDTKACIAFYGRNNLPSAIIILYLLERGVGFVLCSSGQQAPAFCRYLLRCDGPADSSQEMPSDWAIEQCLCLEENLAWLRTDTSYGGRFYARTSGTTSDPKIVLFTQEKLWANAQNCVERFQLTDNDRVVIPVPLYHMYGLGAAFLPAVLAGSSIELQPDSNILRYRQREAEFEPTVAYLTPTFCYALARLRRTPRLYRLTVVAGDKTPPETFELYERSHGCLVNLYGSTELGAIAAGSPDDPFELRCHAAGRPMPGVEVSERGEDVQADEGVSELYFTHPSGGEGYADDRGEVYRGDDRFAEGRFWSKDLGRLGQDGYLRLIGRSDHTVNRDGLLVSFSEVEDGLLKIENIEAAVVLSNGTTPRGAQLTALCVLLDNGVDAQTIREESRRHLPAYAVPDRVVLIDEIPRLRSGKPDRRALHRLLDG